MRLKITYRRLALLAASLFLIQIPAEAFAASYFKDLQAPFYEPTSGICSSDIAGNIGDSSSAATTTGTIYQSGLKPPYIMEQFAIHTLKAIANKKNVNENSVVTKEHVVALLAFMYGEGGDINNDDLFNPLNTGLAAPELISGGARSDGVQSFKSFDAGVEATARTMVGSNQSRLAETLVDPTSTARDFMYALTYFSKYPGNKFWAAASLPPNQDGYFQGRMSLVRQVRANYKDMASTVMGTPEHEAVTGKKAPEKLQFTDGSTGANDSSDETPNGGCGNSPDSGNGAVSGDILQTAINFSWPDSGHGKDKADARQSYQDGEPKYNGSVGEDEFSDCGVFVSTVMIARGADKDYPKRGTGVQQDYVKAHPEKYNIITGISDTSKLRPGDILIFNGGGGEGHTFIYTGPIRGGYDGVGASLHGHVPQAVHSAGSITYDGRAGNFIAARIKL